MLKRRLWIWILVAVGLILGPIAACGWSILASPCDFDGYVVDARVVEEFRQDLDSFKSTHDLELDRWSMPLSCAGASYATTVTYRIPAYESQIGVTYTLLLAVDYDHWARSLRIHFSEAVPDTQATLDFLQTLPDRLAGFEQDPRVIEFADVFKRERVRLVGTIHDEFIWIQTDPARHFQPGLTVWSGRIFYDYATQSVTSYSVPNAFTWKTFEEVAQAQAALDDPATTETLAGCTLARGRETYADTSVRFRTTPVSADVDLRLACPDDSRKYLELSVYPDGRIELKGIK